MTQLSLEDAMVARTKARSTDPAPSHLAAAELVTSGKLGTQQAEALALVKARPGRTAWELADGEPNLRYRLNRRLPELVRMGLVHRGTVQVCDVAGRPAQTWWPAKGEGT